MQVQVDGWAWLPKADLSFAQIHLIKKELTLELRQTGPKKEEKAPLILWTESPTHLGIPREFFLSKRRDVHKVTMDLTEGGEDFAPFGRFDGVLRAEQQLAIDTLKQHFGSGRFGGLVRAPPGWGKCLKSLSFLVTEDSGRVAIDNLVGTTPMVPSYDSSEQGVRWSRASQIWQSGEKECYRLQLASGEAVEASYDHPVLTAEGWKPLSELKLGELVATARTVPAPSRSLNISDAEVLVLGALIAAGCAMQHGRVEYCKGNEALTASVCGAAAELPGYEGVRRWYDRGGNYAAFSGLAAWVRRWGLNEASKHKRIPGKLFLLNDSQLALLLRWVWTDGSVYTKKPRKIEICLASESLIDDLQYLLKRFDIQARKSPKKKRNQSGRTFEAWQLQITSASQIVRFLERVGYIPGKESQCAELLDLSRATTSNTNTDVVPVDVAKLEELRKQDATGVWSLSGGLNETSRMGSERFRRLCSESGYNGDYRWYADVSWERVVAIESVGTHPVFDLTVPGSANAVVQGVIVHNTVCSCALLATMNVPTLVILHKEFLMTQWRKRIERFLPEAQIGHVQQDVCDFRGKSVVLGMVHSLSGGKYPKEFYDWPGLILVDECHRIGATTWSPVPPMFRAKYRVGVTATPRRKDGAENAFFYHIGPTIFSGREELLKFKVKRVWTKFKLVKTERFNPSLAPRTLVITFLCKSTFRNRIIVEQMISALQARRKLIVLSERLDHLRTLGTYLEEMWPDNSGPLPSYDFYVGGRSEKDLHEASQARVVFATTQFASEGLDIPELDTLFLTTPMSDVEQAVGRILRPFETKREPVVVDFRDDAVPMFEKQAKRRDDYYGSK